MTAKEAQILKAAFSEIVSAKRFNDGALYGRTEALRELPKAKNLAKTLESFLTPAEIITVFRRLTRAAFVFEPVKDDVTSTKYDVRWGNRWLGKDPRGASFAACLGIYEILVDAFDQLAEEPKFRTELQLALDWGGLPYVFPIDYISKEANPIHAPENTRILRDASYLRLLRIRKSLIDPKINAESDIFKSIFEKIRVKSYLTDRAQTGGYQTNREKRWEAHPLSPQFALRAECFAVELALIEQLFSFENFPKEIITYFEQQKLSLKPSKVARCPVTMDAMDFAMMAEEVANPVHGESTYHVGHLNPLKAGEGVKFRHHFENISWITADGNRIQGHLTLVETRQLLKRISSNYAALIKSGEITAP